MACWSGDVSDTSPRIGGGEAGFFSAQKKWGVYGTQDRVAVMWSVPKGVGYKNWFKMSIIPAKTPTDVALFDDMYYDKHKLTPGNCAPADKGSDAWTVRGYRVEGVMATTGEATLNTLIERA